VSNLKQRWIEDRVVKKYQGDAAAPHAREIAINGL